MAERIRRALRLPGIIGIPLTHPKNTPEVNEINKQKFLAELSQLLTFMYEEDRQDALALYADMFDEAEDEQALIQALVSPIRQAVLVARAYNAKEHKLQAHSQAREADAPREEGAPDFIRAIFDIRAEALNRQPAGLQVDENQFSLFDQAAEAAQAAIPLYEEPEVPVPAAPAAPVPAPEAAPAEPAAPVDTEPPAGDEAAEADAPLFADAEAPEEPEEDEEEPEEETEDNYDLFEEEPREERPVHPGMVRKPRILLLILYVILAIPLTLIGLVLLLIPAALCLGVAAGFIYTGILVASAAFGGFAVLADLLVVAGAALILLALGLLFLWLFVWFIGGAMVGLVRSVIELGGQWCYKEVPAL